VALRWQEWVGGGAGKNCYICEISLPADALQEAYGAFAKDADMTKIAQKIKFD
jgi:hypothetical protein